ncbi:hypothetical protein H4R34_002266 [Dimargaris verticillata]|uniref:F-box domain-containing protein n=1 Tax=Dimargaris verticillata TaxID=2761393 RepID=A0A9W8E9G4_9FUNG|nr:hypothetical protein H4R34_002266 [Dimargaris verticillata]
MKTTTSFLVNKCRSLKQIWNGMKGPQTAQDDQDDHYVEIDPALQSNNSFDTSLLPQYYGFDWTWGPHGDGYPPHSPCDPGLVTGPSGPADSARAIGTSSQLPRPLPTLAPAESSPTRQAGRNLGDMLHSAALPPLPHCAAPPTAAHADSLGPYAGNLHPAYLSPYFMGHNCPDDPAARRRLRFSPSYASHVTTSTNLHKGRVKSWQQSTKGIIRSRSLEDFDFGMRYRRSLPLLVPFFHRHGHPKSRRPTLVSPFAPTIDFMDELPQEIVIHILQYLDAPSLVSVAQVSRRWHQALLDPMLWRAKVLCPHEWRMTRQTSPTKPMPLPPLLLGASAPWTDSTVPSPDRGPAQEYMESISPHALSATLCTHANGSFAVTDGSQPTPMAIDTHDRHPLTNSSEYLNHTMDPATHHHCGHNALASAPLQANGPWQFGGFNASINESQTSLASCSTAMADSAPIFCGNGPTPPATARSGKPTYDPLAFATVPPAPMLNHGSPMAIDDAVPTERPVLMAPRVPPISSHALHSRARPWQHIYQQRYRLEQRWAENGPKIVHYLNGHSDSVYCLQFQDELLVTGSRDRTIKFWNLGDGFECMRTLTGHEGSVLCLKYDERCLVTGSSDSTVMVWDLTTGQEDSDSDASAEDADSFMPLAPEEPNTNHDRPVKRLRSHIAGVLDVSMEDQVIVSCSKDCTIKVWNRETGELARSLVAHRRPVNAVQISGSQMASASGDGLVKLWDVETGLAIRSFEGHLSGLACVQFKDNRILSGSNDKTIKLWDPRVNQCVNTLVGHQDLVRTLHYPGGNRLISGSYDQTVKVWDLAANKCNISLDKGHSSWVFDVQCNMNKLISAGQDQKILIWDFAPDLNEEYLAF